MSITPPARFLEVQEGTSAYSSLPLSDKCSICWDLLSTTPEEEKSEEKSENNSPSPTNSLLIHRVTGQKEDIDHIYHRNCVELAWENLPECPLCKSSTFLEYPKDPARAVTRGALHGRLDLLDIYGPIVSKETRGQAVKIATEVNNLAGVQSLLAQGAPISIQDRGMAVRIAAQRNQEDFNPILTLLLENGIIPEDDWNLARDLVVNHPEARFILDNHLPIPFLEAIAEDRWDRVELFLKNGSFSEEERNEALCRLGEKGQTAILTRLLQYGPISGAVWSQAVSRAAAAGHADIVKILLQSGPILKIARACVIVEAARKGRADIIEMLLENGPIDPLDRRPAICAAVEGGYSNVISVLIAHEAISTDDLEEAVHKAARKGDTSMVKTLLQYGVISQEARDRIVWNAAEDGFLAIVKILVQDGDISDQGRERAIERAAKTRHFDVVRTLLRYESISDGCRELVIRAASASNQPNLVRSLLEKGKISFETQFDAMYEACAFSNIAMLQLLSKNGPISEGNRAALIDQATRNGIDWTVMSGTAWTILNFLLNSGPISTEARGSIIRDHAFYMGSEAATLLLNSGPILERHRDESVKLALVNSHTDVANVLLQSGPVSPAVRRHVLLFAAEKDNLDILSGIGPISAEELDWMIEKAMIAGHLSIVKALLQQGEPKHRLLAISIALTHDQDQNAAQLLQSGPASPAVRRHVLLFAAEKGNLDILSGLAPISENELEWMIEKAVIAGHLSIVKVLLQQRGAKYRLLAISIALEHGQHQIAAQLAIIPAVTVGLLSGVFLGVMNYYNRQFLTPSSD